MIFMSDPINHPSHYQFSNGLETFDAIEAFTENCDGYEGYLVGNVTKYISRWKKKNGVEDLKKALFYLDQLIKYEEK